MTKRAKICPVCGEIYLKVKRIGNHAGHLVIWYIHVELSDGAEYCERDTVTGEVERGRYQRAYLGRKGKA